MPFTNFAYPNVREALKLTLNEEDLFSVIPPMELSADFSRRLRQGIALAQSLHTEKARSEFIIAPLLLELWSLLDNRFGLFSGPQFDVDPERGLNGFCDFILTRSPMLTVLTAPVVAIVEAKNDNISTGLGQCIAAMVAAREFNAETVPPVPAIYGITTTGINWRFLRLIGAAVTVDSREYLIAEPGRIMGILAHILAVN